ncbi:MAG TPA: hypothetical protein VMY88_00570 [Acidimicrobiales bacterium]|nr:hypothetical protein [Acidimicrobiales bacterium]
MEQFRATNTDPDNPDPASGDAAATPQADIPTPAGGPAAPGAAPSAPPAGTPGSPSAPGAPASKPPVTSGPRGAEGVYPHRTEGFEQTDAVGGSRHDYPAESSVVVRHTDCGLTTRWQPLKERWDESSFCSVGSALEIRTFSMYHEFFQKGQQDDYRCPPGSIVFDRNEPVGASWMWHCDTENASVDTQTRVVGVEPLTIEGRRIDAVRMRYESRLTGSTEGAQLQERWIDPESGMVLRLRSEVAAKTESPFGRVNYEEKYLIEVKSLAPRT